MLLKEGHNRCIKRCLSEDKEELFCITYFIFCNKCQNCNGEILGGSMYGREREGGIMEDLGLEANTGY